jgi:hypothetical protein
VFGIAKTQAIGTRKAWPWGIGVTHEVDPHNVALARNHIAINSVSHRIKPSASAAAALRLHCRGGF